MVREICAQTDNARHNTPVLVGLPANLRHSDMVEKPDVWTRSSLPDVVLRSQDFRWIGDAECRFIDRKFVSAYLHVCTYIIHTYIPTYIRII